MRAGTSYTIGVQVQNTGVFPWTCDTETSSFYKLGYTWRRTYRDEDRIVTEEQPNLTNRASVCGLAPGAATPAATPAQLTINDLPNWTEGTISLNFDIFATTIAGTTSFKNLNWPTYDQTVRVCGPQTCGQARKQDIIFVIDTTHSMNGGLSSIQQAATSIVNALADSGADYRAAVIDYRDFSFNSDGVFGDYAARLALDFSSDRNTIVHAINSLTASGGGGPDETVYAGVMAAVGQPWRTDAEKGVVLIGDGLPHDPEPNTGYTRTSVIAAANAISPAANGAPARPVHIYPVAISSYATMRAAFQPLADGTGGTLFETNATADVGSLSIGSVDTAVHAPAALAGSAYAGQAGQPIAFDGLASYDPTTVVSRYEWDFDGDGVFDSISADPTTAYTYNAAFSGIARLRVTNDGGYSASATVPVSVGSSTNPTSTPPATPSATATPTNTPTRTPTSSPTKTPTATPISGSTVTPTTTPATSTRIKDITFEGGSLTYPITGVDQINLPVDLESTTPLKGSSSARVVKTSTTGTLIENVTAVNDLYVSFYLRLTDLPASSARIALITAGTSTGNLVLMSNGTLQLKNGSTLIASSGALSLNTLYRIGIHQKTGADGTALLEAFVAAGDAVFGTPFASSTAAVSGQATRLTLGATNGNVVDATFDDIRLDTAAMPAP